MGGDLDPSHVEHEEHGWTRRIPDHPPRVDSAAYVHSRAKMNAMADGISPFFYGDPDFEDHHGGGLWLKDDDGWFMVRNVAGIEWSAQFCADPAKVDQLRITARRLYAMFPDAVEELGIRDLLDTKIEDAAGVQAWTDSICNASVPLPAGTHRGVLPAAGGIHHYPAPVAEIAFFKYDDFELWVSDSQGNEIAVVPVAPRGAGDGRVQVLHVRQPDPPDPVPPPDWGAVAEGILDQQTSIAEKAFGEQYRKIALGEVDASDPLANATLPGDVSRRPFGPES
jgi:Family of unknown function (DUF6424)